jgi:multidrug transporter EmrE-like cation transporter
MAKAIKAINMRWWVESDLPSSSGKSRRRRREPSCPSKGSFIASLITAVIALIDALSPIPYITAYGIWVALLAYVIANLAQTSSDN